ncbi:uncharacterized protein LOC120453352 [Drosophila santomea]|uniref:uncharacterized protein LOC120453352 n=1 Tax=Drosophila santomea TaxID=129105 RepID=UPI001952EA97|nr:uncharacterized protein LOC120453352 [Drosophila santomea]
MSTRTKKASCSNAIEMGSSGIGNCWPTILTLAMLMVANLVDARKSGESIQLATGSPPSLSINNAEGSLEQLIEMRLNESASASVQNSQSASQELLSRKRRYLVFPEGSSFQMVYDEIVGIVDHTNYLILGITVALAWELPSKPPTEELDDLLTKLEDGTIDISRNDTVSNITYVDADVDVDASTTTTSRPAADYKPNYINLSSYGSSSSGSNSYYNSYYSHSPVFRTPMHPSHRLADSYYSSRPKGGRRKDNHYYYSSSNPFAKWTRPYSHAQNSRYPYWALNSRLKDRYYGYKSQQAAPPVAQRRQDSTTAPTTSRPTRRPAPRHHRIYPVFGKRSIPDAANPHKRQRRSGVATEHEDKMSRLEQLQIKHHRSSRQSLYERIEKYLDKRGHHGHHCVLRTLCETGQKSEEEEPGTFVGELMRAVFTLPEAMDNEPVAYRDTHYDKAHATKADCAALYPECKQSMWQAQFIQ